MSVRRNAPREHGLVSLSRRGPNLFLIAAVLVGASLSVAACGSSSSGAGKSSPSSSNILNSQSAPLTDVSFGFAPISSFVLPYIAQEQGIAAKHGLNLVEKDITTGAAEIPEVLSGQLTFGQTDMVGAVSAISNGIGIQVVAKVGTVVNPDPAKQTAGVVTADSKVQSLADLKGKSIAVNSLNNFPSLVVTQALANAGLSQSDVHLVQIPLASELQAIKSGQVSAGLAIEPFLQQAKAAGLRDLGLGSEAPFANGPSGVYIVSKSWAEAHPKLLADFIATMTDATNLVKQDPSVLVQATIAHTKTSADVIKAIPTIQLGDFSATIDSSTFQAEIDAMLKYKFIKVAPKGSIVTSS